MKPDYWECIVCGMGGNDPFRWAHLRAYSNHMLRRFPGPKHRSRYRCITDEVDLVWLNPYAYRIYGLDNMSEQNYLCLKDQLLAIKRYPEDAAKW